VAEAHWKLLEEARALGRSGQDREALMAYRNLLLLYPEAADAWTDYGDLLLTLNQVEGALNAYSNPWLLSQIPFMPWWARGGHSCGWAERKRLNLGLNRSFPWLPA